MGRSFARVVTAVIVGLGGMTGVLGAVAAPAGAQAQSCTFIVSPVSLPSAGTAEVSGVAPGTTSVDILVDGRRVATVQSAPVTGAWGPVRIAISATSTVSIALPETYATLPCIGNGGNEVVTVSVGTTSKPLAFTGSATSRTVLFALAVIGVGSVLLVSARRRRTAHQRV